MDLSQQEPPKYFYQEQPAWMKGVNPMDVEAMALAAWRWVIESNVGRMATEKELDEAGL